MDDAWIRNLAHNHQDLLKAAHKVTPLFMDDRTNRFMRLADAADANHIEIDPEIEKLGWAHMGITAMLAGLELKIQQTPEPKNPAAILKSEIQKDEYAEGMREHSRLFSFWIQEVFNIGKAEASQVVQDTYDHMKALMREPLGLNEGQSRH